MAPTRNNDQPIAFRWSALSLSASSNAAPAPSIPRVPAIRASSGNVSSVLSIWPPLCHYCGSKTGKLQDDKGGLSSKEFVEVGIVLGIAQIRGVAKNITVLKGVAKRNNPSHPLRW